MLVAAFAAAAAALAAAVLPGGRPLLAGVLPAAFAAAAALAAAVLPGGRPLLAGVLAAVAPLPVIAGVPAGTLVAVAPLATLGRTISSVMNGFVLAQTHLLSLGPRVAGALVVAGTLARFVVAGAGVARG